jgi:hypothetical protein
MTFHPITKTDYTKTDHNQNGLLEKIMYCKNLFYTLSSTPTRNDYSDNQLYEDMLQNYNISPIITTGNESNLQPRLRISFRRIRSLCLYFGVFDGTSYSIVSLVWRDIGVKPLIHQSELETYTKVVPFQEKSSFHFVVLWKLLNGMD